MARVLVADDEPDIRAALAAELEDEGHTVIQAPDGDQVLGAAVEYRVDVILLDLMMARVSGFEALHALRAYPSTRDIPVVIVSARGNPDDRVRARALGATDYINKPWTEGEVVMRVGLALASVDRNAAIRRFRAARPESTTAQSSRPAPTVTESRAGSAGNGIRRARGGAFTPAQPAPSGQPVAARKRRQSARRTTPGAARPADAPPVVPVVSGRFAVQVEASIRRGGLPARPANAMSSFLLTPVEDPNWVVRVDTFESKAEACQAGFSVYEMVSGVTGASSAAARFALLAKWKLMEWKQAMAFERNRRGLLEAHRRHLPGLTAEWLYRCIDDELKYLAVALFADEENWLKARSHVKTSPKFAASSMRAHYGATELYGWYPCQVELAE